MSLAVLADVVGGELVDPTAGNRAVTSITIDSRTAGPEAVFVALPGEQVDGHDFVADAVALGASGALVARVSGAAGEILVDDVADALLGLGAWIRTEVDPIVVAVTGSTGKTTTKDLIRAAVSGSRAVVANIGSYNNELGVPLTCCQLEPGTEVLVAEVGARGAGHIATMAAVLRPDIAVVTNVGAAHLEMFEDLAGVARAKAEIVEALSPSGVAVLNADDPLVAAMAEVTKGRVVTYGLGGDAMLQATDIAVDRLARPSFTVDGVRVEVPLPGVHNVANALAALAAARACDVGLAAAADGLRAAAVSRWRMELHVTPDGVTVLNDAYNANPSSMAAALRTLAEVEAPGRRWAVLGHMAELGAAGPQAHRDIGRLCVALGLDGLVVVGNGAAGIADAARDDGFAGLLRTAEDVDGAITLIRSSARRGDVVLVKASRSVGLERVALALVGQDPSS